MILLLEVLALIACLGVTLYECYSLIIYILGKKVHATIIDVDTIEGANDSYSVVYTYKFNLNGVSRIVKGPKTLLLFPPILSDKKFFKKVYISYNEKTDKVSRQLHSILLLTFLGLLSTSGLIVHIHSMIIL